MDVSDFFFCSGEGKGKSEVPGRGEGVGVFYQNPRGVGGSQRGGGGAVGDWEGVRGEFFFGGGGAKYFFSGPNCPPSEAFLLTL